MPVNEQVYEYIIKYKRRWDGNSPSVRVIAADLALAPSRVHWVLGKLEGEKRISRAANTRAICIPNGVWRIDENNA